MVTRLVIEHLNDKKQKREGFQQKLKEERDKEWQKWLRDPNFDPNITPPFLNGNDRQEPEKI